MLVLAPNLRAAAVNRSTAMSQRYAGELMATLEARGYLDLGLAAGSSFAHARTFRRAGPLGPGNVHPISNVVFAGTGTHPGIGVPMVLISGKLAAARLVS